MKDMDYLSAIERQYLMAHPDQVEWIADLATADYGAILGEWPGTPEGRRYLRAAELDRAADASPHDAPDLRTRARHLRDSSLD